MCLSGKREGPAKSLKEIWTERESSKAWKNIHTRRKIQNSYFVFKMTGILRKIQFFSKDQRKTVEMNADQTVDDALQDRQQNRGGMLQFKEESIWIFLKN